MKFDAKQLRDMVPTPEQLAEIKHKPVYLILDNVLDTYNIGAIFRIAEAFCVTELWLCGGSETPPSGRIHKSAVGTEMWVPWKYAKSVAEAVGQIKVTQPQTIVVGVEQDERAISLYDLPVKPTETTPVALVFGHETDGMTKESREVCDYLVELPMWGVNKSLNVMVTTGVALYWLFRPSAIANTEADR